MDLAILLSTVGVVFGRALRVMRAGAEVVGAKPRPAGLVELTPASIDSPLAASDAPGVFG
jgi:hypothetical protein